MSSNDATLADRQRLITWCWWITTPLAIVTGYVAGWVVSVVSLRAIGNMDVRWNIHTNFGIDYELIDFLSGVPPAYLVGLATMRAGTRSHRTALVVIAAPVVTWSAAWLLLVHPQHTNQLEWNMPTSTLAALLVTMFSSTLLAARWATSPWKTSAVDDRHRHASRNQPARRIAVVGCAGMLIVLVLVMVAAERGVTFGSIVFVALAVPVMVVWRARVGSASEFDARERVETL